ncbi:MAG: hypothetical protein F4018_01130 [Acidobacteria bacterium]|nr:hypothetical protein [Acidobacteriota bacterium]
MRLGVCLTKDGRDLVRAIRDAARELEELTRAAKGAGGVAHRYVAASRKVSGVLGVASSAVLVGQAAGVSRTIIAAHSTIAVKPPRRSSSCAAGVEVAGRGDVISPSIHGTVENSAGGDANGFGSELGLRIRRELEPLIRDVMVNERRPGGVLNPTDRIHV